MEVLLPDGANHCIEQTKQRFHKTLKNPKICSDNHELQEIVSECGYIVRDVYGDIDTGIDGIVVDFLHPTVEHPNEDEFAIQNAHFIHRLLKQRHLTSDDAIFFEEYHARFIMIGQNAELKQKGGVHVNYAPLPLNRTTKPESKISLNKILYHAFEDLCQRVIKDQPRGSCTVPLYGIDQLETLDKRRELLHEADILREQEPMDLAAYVQLSLQRHELIRQKALFYAQQTQELMKNHRKFLTFYGMLDNHFWEVEQPETGKKPFEEYFSGKRIIVLIPDRDDLRKFAYYAHKDSVRTK